MSYLSAVANIYAFAYYGNPFLLFKNGMALSTG